MIDAIILRRIKKWMDFAWKTSSYLNHDDLHIDVINNKLSKKQKKWFFKGIEYLKLADVLRTKMKIPIKVFLAFSLKDTREQKNISVKTVNDFMKEIDDHPPSFYLLDFSQLQKNGILLTNNKISIMPYEIGCYYLQFFHTEEKTMRRSLWFFFKD